MASSDLKEKLLEQWHSLSDQIQESEQFQQLKSKWDDLDAQSKMYLKFAAVGAGLVLAILMCLMTIWSVHGLKDEYLSKRALLAEVKDANTEIKQLRGIAPNAGTGTSPINDQRQSWPEYLETVATSSGVPKEGFTLSQEKSGSSSEQAKEYLFEITLKHITPKKLVQFIFNLENGKRPVKLRNLTTSTGNLPKNTTANPSDPSSLNEALASAPDPQSGSNESGNSESGYLNAALAISAFTLVTPK